MSIESIKEKISRAIADHLMLEKGDKVLVALSGGKDSVCLLHSLLSLSERYGITVAACHLDHMIRGEEAKRDERFSEKLCEELGVRIFVRSEDIPKKASEEKKSLEEAAREARYGFFGDLAEAEGFNKIAVAHTLSDQCETVIFNIARGRGLSGAAGIPEKRPLSPSSPAWIIRPLIYLTTEEVLEYVSEYSLDYVTDSTNKDTVYSRNLIRIEIIPLLKRINPAFEKAVSELTREGREYRGLIRSECDRFISENGLSDLPRTCPTEAASRLALMENGGSILYELLSGMQPEGTDGMKRERFDSLREFLIRSSRTAQSPSGKEIDMGGGISCVFYKESFGFVKKNNGNSENRLGKNEWNGNKMAKLFCDAESSISLQLGDNDIGFADCIIRVEPILSTLQIKDPSKKSLAMYVSIPSALEGLYVRPRRSGDKVFYGGMSHSAKNILSESDIPPSRRGSIPVLCDGDGILWIPGGTVCDRANPLKNENSGLSVYKISYIQR